MQDSSKSSSVAQNTLQILKATCELSKFAPGSVLREKGGHYKSMYLVTAGEVEIDLGSGHDKFRPAASGIGLPIGEFGFLRGVPATATVAAVTDVDAVVIDDVAMSQLEQDHPTIAVNLLRLFAETAEERTSHNISLAAAKNIEVRDPAIEIWLCRDADMLDKAMRLRYDVYCSELGRESPHADHDRKHISDDLDQFGHTFIAVEGGRAIGTLRANRPSEGSIGILEVLYGMQDSEFHPDSTIICTKFIIAEDKRISAAGMQLVIAFARYGLQHDIRECYIDCIPSLRPYYTAIGFRKCGEKFLHRENGPSFPMMIDLVKYRGRIERVSGKFA